MVRASLCTGRREAPFSVADSQKLDAVELFHIRHGAPSTLKAPGRVPCRGTHHHSLLKRSVCFNFCFVLIIFLIFSMRSRPLHSVRRPHLRYSWETYLLASFFRSVALQFHRKTYLVKDIGSLAVLRSTSLLLISSRYEEMK